MSKPAVNVNKPGELKPVVEFHLAPLNIKPHRQVVMPLDPADLIVSDDIVAGKTRERIVTETEIAADADRLNVIGRWLIGNVHAEGADARNVGGRTAL